MADGIEPARPSEPHMHAGRPVDPQAAQLRAEKNPVRRLVKVLGPGLITGASDDDPSGIGTYAQAGAQHGFATLWATLVMLPMMIGVQYMCAKIGLVTGHGLAGVLREHHRRALYPAVLALVVANTLNAGADIGAIAAAINLIVPIPAIVFIVPVSVGIVALQVFGTYRLIERIFKWLALALLAYIAAALFARPDPMQVLTGTLIPTIRLDPAYIGILVALLGTTISPYLFFWQASQEVEEQISIGRRHLWQREGASRFELRNALWDTIGGWSSRRSWPTSSSSRPGRRCSPPARPTSRPRPMPPRRSARSPATPPRSCSRSASSAPACWPSPYSQARPPTASPRPSAGDPGSIARSRELRSSTR